MDEISALLERMKLLEERMKKLEQGLSSTYTATNVNIIEVARTVGMIVESLTPLLKDYEERRNEAIDRLLRSMTIVQKYPM